MYMKYYALKFMLVDIIYYYIQLYLKYNDV